VERLVRREFERIARDRRSGAAELALRAARALTRRLHRSPKLTRAEALELAGALLRAQPEMAPFLRLANEMAAAAETKNPAEKLAPALRSYIRRGRSAPGEMGRRLRAALRPAATVVTYSRSSTVLGALAEARSKIARVYCSESRPGGEGRAMAAQLARRGLRVTLLTDAALFALPAVEEYVILGADRITARGFVNKVGSALLAARAWRTHGPPEVWLLADTSKFLPLPLERLFVARPGPPRELWRSPPRGVRVENPYFRLTPFSSRMRLLTERGWMTPQQARQFIARIAVARGFLRLAMRRA
jgi:translation initiation factor 2B subunit (eIF-2B alpha/beta/delta family)